MAPTQVFDRAARAATAFFCLAAVWLGASLGGERATLWFGDLGQLVAPLAAVAACAVAARRSGGRTGLGLALLGASALAWGIGQGIWSWYELIRGVEVPFPSVADIGYVGSIPLAAAGLLVLPGDDRMASRARALIDGLIITGSLLFVSWATVLEPLFHMGDEGHLAHTLSISYPIGDVVIASLALAVAARSRAVRAPLLLVAAGLLSIAVADSYFAWSALHDTYATGAIGDLGWIGGFLLIGLGALRFLAPRAEATEPWMRRAGALPLMLPYVPVGLAFGVAASRVLGGERLDAFLFWNATAVAVGVVVRQLFTIADNLGLAQNLEAKVQARTAELESAVRELEFERRRQEDFRTFLERVVSSSAMVVIRGDMKGSLSYVSPNCERIVRYTREEMMSGARFVAERIHPEDRATVLAARDEAAAAGMREQEAEFRFRAGDGRYLTLKGFMRLEYDAEGRAAGFSGLMEDVTEQKRAEIRQVAQYAVTKVLADAKTLPEATPRILEAICVSLDWEYGGLWMVEQPEEEGADALLRCVETWHVPGIDLDDFIEQTRRMTFRIGEALPGGVWQDGEPRWVPDFTVDMRPGTRAEPAAREGLRGILGFPVRLADEIIGVMEFFSQEVREPDEAIRQMMGAMGSQIGQFIARKKADEETVRAKEAAERATKAKSEFLSRMSHELRTPLNAINGFAQLLLDDELTGQQKEDVGHIYKSGQLLLSLINEVLDIARIEAGGMSLSIEPVPLAEVIDEAREIIRPIAAAKDYPVEAHPNELWERYVSADRQRLKQVLINFGSNAVKYAEALTIECVEPEPGRVRIRFADRGPGLTPEQVGRLFREFDRLGADRTSIEGTGLGLAHSKALVEAMGGTIGAESTHGTGSVFWVELPVTASPLDATDLAAPEPVAAAAGDGAEPTGTVHRVLYVEDNIVNYRVIERTLARRPSIELIPAMSGGLGLELARAHRPDLILLDMNLPDMLGSEVLERLKADPGTQPIPVVMISADATPGQAERMVAAGALAYLTKPLDVAGFLGIVDRALVGASS